MIGFDKEKPTDLTYHIEGITIHIDKKHTMYLIGKEVDFYEGADAKDFCLPIRKTNYPPDQISCL